MPWIKNNPDLSNGSAYLEPRVTAVESKANSNTEQLADIAGVDIAKHGGKGDYVTDDTAALQNAINASPIVFLGANKRYKISTINLPDRITILIGNNVYIESTSSTGFVFKKGGTSSMLSTTGIDFNNTITHRLTDCSPYAVHEFFGNLELNNPINAAFGSMNVANFAGQGLPNAQAPIGFIFHHYTDGNMVQMDNVGAGVGLTINNARNTLRRGDKPSDFVGTGNFLDMRQTFVDGSGNVTNKSILYFTNNGNMIWNTNTARFTANKPDDGLWGFLAEIITEHNNIFNLKNGTENFQLARNTGDGVTEYKINPKNKHRTIYSKGIAEFVNSKAEDGLYGFTFKTNNAHANSFAVINGSSVELLVGNGTVDIGNVLNLKTLSTPPTPRKGSIYFNGTDFFMCDGSLTWKKVTLT